MGHVSLPQPVEASAPAALAASDADRVRRALASALAETASAATLKVGRALAGLVRERAAPQRQARYAGLAAELSRADVSPA